jgi:hypothetical protein
MGSFDTGGPTKEPGLYPHTEAHESHFSVYNPEEAKCPDALAAPGLG